MFLINSIHLANPLSDHDVKRFKTFLSLNNFYNNKILGF